MDRTNEQKRTDRLAVMSAAHELFKTRQSNLARRDPQGAKRMRWAGEEATFCLAESKFRQAYDAQVRATVETIRANERDLIGRMSPEQRELRIRAILAEIEFLPYRPLSVNISEREASLRVELQALLDASKPESFAHAVLHQELIETAEGRVEPSPELTKLRERARVGTNPRGALAVAVLNAAGVL